MDQPSSQRFLIVYGKGGIGKTTVATNLGEALAHQKGRKVMLVGCSPKSSLIDLYDLSGEVLPILDLKRKEGVNAQNIGKAVWTSREGILLTETGGPEPGIGCAGVGLPTAFGELKKYKAQIQDFDKVEYNIYDLIGDVVCGGFSTPLRGGGREVLIIISGELMAIYAGNNILRAVKAVGGNLKVLGYVVNMRGVPREKEIVEAFAARTRVPILAFIKRDPIAFKEAERRGGPIVRTLPESEIAATFLELAQNVEQGAPKTDPAPIASYDDLFEMFLSFQGLHGEEGKEGRTAYVSRIPPKTVERAKPLRVSIYGTGGIGKSTVSANVSAAMVLMGEKIFQIGCDPKHDSIANLCGGLKPTVLDEIQKRGGARAMNRDILKELIFPGVNHDSRLYGTECGGPVPGKGCAGKGVDLALKLFEDHGLMDEYKFTLILYDVLGDTVCGGFARPLKYTPQAYIVANGEAASLTQAMKIAQSIQAAGQRGVEVGIGGVINNMRGVPNEEAIVEEAFGMVGIPVIHHIPRCELVQTAENLRTTVVESFPGSEQARHYMELAKRLRENSERHKLTREILSNREIMAVVNKHS
ncbi:MAG: AAA family ATPase [Deltaproteobacteria bacterium]|nr:AAA family ATPase [Deltaproteobacteria bacterium]